MKKTLLALAVMTAAGSAQAVELYNQDGATVNLGGDIEVRYVEGTKKGDEFKQEIHDSDLNFDIRYELNDNLSVGGYWALNDLATDGEGGDAYVSLISADLGTLKVGKTATQLDDAGIGSDYLFGVQSAVDAADFSGDEVIRYDMDKETFYVGVALMQDKNDADMLGKDGSFADFKVGARVDDFDLSAFYGASALRGTKDDNGTKVPLNEDHSTLALQATFSGVENLNLQAGYYVVDIDKKMAAASDYDTTTYAIAADYTMDKVTFAGGYSSTGFSNNEEDHSDWFVNAGYSVATNTTVYAEVGGNDKKSSQTGFGVGVTSSF